MKLSEKTFEAIEYLQKNGGRATTEEMRVALDCEKIASITGRVNSLVKNGLAYREKVAVDGEDSAPLESRYCHVEGGGHLVLQQDAQP